MDQFRSTEESEQNIPSLNSYIREYKLNVDLVRYSEEENFVNVVTHKRGALEECGFLKEQHSSKKRLRVEYEPLYKYS